MKVCIVGASGKLGQYMIRHTLDRGYEVVGVCRAQSVAKLDPFKGRTMTKLVVHLRQYAQLRVRLQKCLRAIHANEFCPA